MNLVKISFLLFLFSSHINAQNDCKDAIIVCGNSGFQGLNAIGPGDVLEYNISENSCFSSENNSIWLKLLIKTSGTLGFILKPESQDIVVDFDFLVFGPTATCNSLGQSIRCSTTNPALARLPNNTTGMTGQYFDTTEGPGENGDGFVRWLDVNAGETYFIVIDRFTGNSNFSLEWLGTATFDDPPSLNIASENAIDLEKSDYSGETNPKVSFDLTQNTPIIMGSQTDVTVTYHTSSNDAILDLNAIENPADFKNTSNQQIVYARITNNKTKCYNWAAFNLKISDKLVFPNTTIVLCDNADSNSTDGKTAFNLNETTASIFENLIIQDLTFKYYLSQDDAETETNPLSSPFFNTIPNKQSIFIKASGSKSSVAIQEIQLIVNPLPEINNATLIQCDAGKNTNGLVLFNLKEANPTLTNNNQDLETVFFLNNDDAINNSNSLNTEYTNISNPQILFVRVINSKTKCYSISTLTLKTNVIQELTYNLNAVCDDDGIEDGIHLFNLTNANIPLATSQTIRYYTNENDALLEKNPIEKPASYSNEIPYNQEVYARIEEGNDCYGINTIKLQVNKLPNIEPDMVTNVCENLPLHKAHLEAGIIDIASITDFTFTWLKDGVKIPNETSSQLDVNQSGIYTVEITNKTNCTKTKTIEVTASNAASIKNIDIIDLLETDSNQITVNVLGKGEYEYSLNAPNGPFQESNTFSNLKSGFYEVYINDKKNCGMVHRTAALIGAPKFFTPNADGYNDYWNLVGLDTSINKNAIIYIYDRFGKLLKQIRPSDLGWDGTFTGTPLPSDDYWYTLKLEDNREAKGHFSLKR
ncbi:T9SS type B sorting domain-containing protein [Flavobacterium piscisymbiosum]|uniref:T9SS type B sorting domain-containing protein n=1 Tax=Flavobacterium piscisymbiosum TaxID=2893753 RepID=A0ABS8MM54_9FLAO|nr:T9SS type B sorting domain-containing protein [Flavobacterium sp. F-30]MCC9066574.1 T9SS type B sorting domain-containing protein [Flavobacterium sp. F-30]